MRPGLTGTSPPAVGPSAWPQSLVYQLSQSRSFSCRRSCQYLPEKQTRVSVMSNHCSGFVFDFWGWVPSIGAVRLFVVPSGARRSPWHDSAPRLRLRVPPPPGSALAPVSDLDRAGCWPLVLLLLLALLLLPVLCCGSALCQAVPSGTFSCWLRPS